MADVKDILKEQEKRLREMLNIDELPTHEIVSKEYKEYKESFMPKTLTWYEKTCRTFGKILSVKLPEEKREKLEKYLKICHLEITPEDTTSFSFIASFLLIIFGLAFSFFVGSIFLSIFFLFFGIFFISVLQKIPEFIATSWRMKTSNQMVLCVFYLVTYMRHTSNLERAIHFASEHLIPPLALDMKKILWDVENGNYKTIKDSLEIYLSTWLEWNKEFAESIHLIESSLYEPSEKQRQEVLDKALERILEETSEKMTHYAQELKSPITMLHMLGVVLPILGLVILPLIVSFSESAQWWHIAVVYNITLPIIVFIMSKNVLSKRPSGYGDTDITEINPELKKYKNTKFLGINMNPIIPATIIFLIFFSIALSPLLIHTVNKNYDLKFFDFELLGYKNSTKQFQTTTIWAPEGEKQINTPKKLGPYGLGSTLISLFFPLAFGLSAGLYFKTRSKKVIQIRTQTQKLENEFADSLFQLSNRLQDGLPAEIAFEKVSEVTTQSATGLFFKTVSMNIRKYGMGIKQAIFNKKTGAILMYPSNIIHSSMKVLVESTKRGPLIAANAMAIVSRYIKEIHRVNERLKDLLAEIISDMKSQISFLTPIIAAIVIGITSMITFILLTLSKNVQQFGVKDQGGLTGILDLFGDGIPTYYFQLVVGIYVVQIVYLLTMLANKIENGEDKLSEMHELGKNLTKSTIMYCIISAIIIIAFNIIAQGILCKGANKCI
ncbi:hypothetical protein HZA97_10265 [Candidatus Woesearchaeota archaeon]|nr:hypothetical protein [Candidatus Woesearchaeota archaeon]